MNQQSGDSPDPPHTVAQVFTLYYDQFKPLYNGIQAHGSVPVELLFEVVAAWDHLSRHWEYEQPEAACADRAASHIKRATFDAYKHFLRIATDEYDILKKVDTSIIDNGTFDGNMHTLISEIRIESAIARTAEGDTGVDGWSNAFDAWSSVYSKCERFHKEFFLNPAVEWAKRKQVKWGWYKWTRVFLTGVLASLCAWAVTTYLICPAF